MPRRRKSSARHRKTLICLCKSHNRIHATASASLQAAIFTQLDICPVMPPPQLNILRIRVPRVWTRRSRHQLRRQVSTAPGGSHTTIGRWRPGRQAPFLLRFRGSCGRASTSARRRRLRSKSSLCAALRFRACPWHELSEKLNASIQHSSSAHPSMLKAASMQVVDESYHALASNHRCYDFFASCTYCEVARNLFPCNWTTVTKLVLFDCTIELYNLIKSVQSD